MPLTECPECSQKLGEQDLTCAHCGWPHGDEVKTEQEESSPEPKTPAEAAGSTDAVAKWSTRNSLLLGLVIGMVIGFLGGRTWPGKGVPAAPMENPGIGDRALAQENAQPRSLKLRELQWKQSSPELCTGVFEVVYAPPSVKGLKFSVMNAQGEVISRDTVSAPQGIKPNTALEMGFETKSCSEIQKWHVQIIDK